MNMIYFYSILSIIFFKKTGNVINKQQDNKEDFGAIRSTIQEFQSQLAEEARRPFIALITGHDHIKYSLLDEKENFYTTQEQWAGEYIGEVSFLFFLFHLFFFSLFHFFLIKQYLFI